MAFISSTSDLSKINSNYSKSPKSPITPPIDPTLLEYNRLVFDSDNNQTLDNIFVGNFVSKYDLRDKLILENQSWNIKNHSTDKFDTPLSNYIDSTKPFYGGNIQPYSKGSPLDSITFETKLTFDEYPTYKPYSFDEPKQLPVFKNIFNLDFSLPFENKLGVVSNFIKFDYPKQVPKVPYSFNIPFGYNEKSTNDFSLPYENIYTTYKLKPYSKGSPLDSITFETKLTFDKYPTYKPYSFDEPKQSKPFNNIFKLDFSLPFEKSSLKSKFDYDNNKILDNTFSDILTNSQSKSMINTLNNIYFGNNTNVFASTTTIISGMRINSASRFGSIYQMWMTSPFDRINDVRKRKRLVLSKSKGNSHISVGQANDSDEIYFGDSYYDRVDSKSDVLGINNATFNKSHAWKSFISTDQPFIYFKPPGIGSNKPRSITHDGLASLLDLLVIQSGRRGGNTATLRNTLGVRASDAILKVSHFLTDTARRQSVKPQLPVKLSSSIVGGLSKSLFKKPQEEFSDNSNNPLENDMITFAFEYFDKDLNFTNHLQFKSYITQFNETVSPEWSSGKYTGHPNNYYLYKGVTRKLQVSFVIYSQNEYQRELNWKKINKLASLCYPQYSTNNRMQGPILKLHLGSLYKGMPGFIESLTFDVQNNMPWETQDRELPHGISVNMNYTIIGHVLPELDNNIHFDTFKTKRFGSNITKNDFFLDKPFDDINPLSLDGLKTMWDSRDVSGENELYEKVNRLKNDAISIGEETVSNALPF